METIRPNNQGQDPCRADISRKTEQNSLESCSCIQSVVAISCRLESEQAIRETSTDQAVLHRVVAQES